MNFLDAVHALAEGRATRIRREKWFHRSFLKADNEYKLLVWDTPPIVEAILSCQDVLADDWEASA